MLVRAEKALNAFKQLLQAIIFTYEVVQTRRQQLVHMAIWHSEHVEGISRAGVQPGLPQASRQTLPSSSNRFFLDKIEVTLPAIPRNPAKLQKRGHERQREGMFSTFPPSVTFFGGASSHPFSRPSYYITHLYLPTDLGVCL